MPEVVLPRARSSPGLGGWVVSHARPETMLGFVAVSMRVIPGRLTECALERLVQWAGYLANNKVIQLTMRRCRRESGSLLFSGSSSLNGPVLGSSFAGTCSSPPVTRRWQRPS